jgi:hypothetical protein
MVRAVSALNVFGGAHTRLLSNSLMLAISLCALAGSSSPNQSARQRLEAIKRDLKGSADLPSCFSAAIPIVEIKSTAATDLLRYFDFDTSDVKSNPSSTFELVRETVDGTSTSKIWKMKSTNSAISKRNQGLKRPRRKDLYFLHMPWRLLTCVPERQHQNQTPRGHRTGRSDPWMQCRMRPGSKTPRSLRISQHGCCTRGLLSLNAHEYSPPVEFSDRMSTSPISLYPD